MHQDFRQSKTFRFTNHNENYKHSSNKDDRMNSLRFKREVLVTKNSNAYILVWYFFMCGAVLSRNCMWLHRPLYVQATSICRGNLQMFLNSRPKFLLVSFRLMQGLLLCIKFSILKLHLEATDL